MTLERKCSDGREEHVWLHFPWHHLKYNPVKGMMDGMSCHRRREKVSLFLGQLLVQSRGRQLQADVSQLPSPSFLFPSPHLTCIQAVHWPALPSLSAAVCGLTVYVYVQAALLGLFSRSQKTCGRSQGHEDTVMSTEPHGGGK